jgi:hypothetical protein
MTGHPMTWESYAMFRWLPSAIMFALLLVVCVLGLIKEVLRNLLDDRRHKNDPHPGAGKTLGL